MCLCVAQLAGLLLPEQEEGVYPPEIRPAPELGCLRTPTIGVAREHPPGAPLKTSGQSRPRRDRRRGGCACERALQPAAGSGAQVAILQATARRKKSFYSFQLTFYKGVASAHFNSYAAHVQPRGEREGVGGFPEKKILLSSSSLAKNAGGSSRARADKPTVQCETNVAGYATGQDQQRQGAYFDPASAAADERVAQPSVDLKWYASIVE